MSSFWMPNKKPLYAPMISSFGGGSSRGYGRGRGVGPLLASLIHQNISYASGQSFLVGFTATVGEFEVTGPTDVKIEAWGGQGGRGRWAGNNDQGAPGGFVDATFTLSPGTYYYFVGEGDKSVPDRSGAGGGSTDVRTFYSSGSNFSRSAFLETTSLDSRIVTAGGGGGSHGGQYGYWGYNGESPGAGGPTKTFTNSNSASLDSGHQDTGASTSGPGLDGGSSMDPAYTADGIFGHGGIQGNPSDVLNYSSSGPYTGFSWPNGGSGTNWANGGGGGGWYGGATNWPNGGGGSNFVQSYGPATLNSVSENSGAIRFGNGQLRITVL